MTTSINQPRRLSQRSARTMLALVSVLALSAVGSASASAQSPSTPPATPAAPVAAPAPATAADVSVEIDDRDGKATEGEDHRYRVEVRNEGSTVARDVGARISLPEEFDVDKMSDESRIVDRGDDEYDYAVGDLDPGQQVTLTVEGQFEDIDADEELDASAQVWNAASGSDHDRLEVDVEEDDDQ